MKTAELPYIYKWTSGFESVSNAQIVTTGTILGQGNFTAELGEDNSNATFQPATGIDAETIDAKWIYNRLQAGDVEAIPTAPEATHVYRATAPFAIEQTRFEAGDELGRGWSPTRLARRGRYAYFAPAKPVVGSGHVLARITRGLVVAEALD